MAAYRLYLSFDFNNTESTKLCITLVCDDVAASGRLKTYLWDFGKKLCIIYPSPSRYGCSPNRPYTTAPE